MKSFIKIKLFIFLLLAFILGISAVFAYSYIASDVGFTPSDNTWNVDNTKDALDDLYTKSDLYRKFDLTLSVDGFSSSYMSQSYIDFNDYEKYYRFFKINKITKVTNYVTNCRALSWSLALQRDYELEVGKEYEIRSSTDGLKLSTITVNTFSTSNSQHARCAISVTFYN